MQSECQALESETIATFWVPVFLIGVVWSQPAVAQLADGLSLTYIPGSSIKLEQVIGDRDYQIHAPTTKPPPGSTFRVTTTTRSPGARAPTPKLGCFFFTNSDGTPLFVEPPGIDMGPDGVPNSGISLADGVYLICNTGANTSLQILTSTIPWFSRASMKRLILSLPGARSHACRAGTS